MTSDTPPDVYALELWPDERLVGRGQLHDVRRIATQLVETITPGQELRIYRASYEPAEPVEHAALSEAGLTVYNAQGVPVMYVGAGEAPRAAPPPVRFTYNSVHPPVETHTRKLAPGMTWDLHWEVRTTNGTQRIPVTHHTTDERQAHLNYADAVARWKNEPEQAYPELHRVWQQTDDQGVEGTHSVRLDLPEMGAGRPTRGKTRMMR